MAALINITKSTSLISRLAIRNEWLTDNIEAYRQENNMKVAPDTN
jgi:hypothetical protein